MCASVRSAREERRGGAEKQKRSRQAVIGLMKKSFSPLKHGVERNKKIMLEGRGGGRVRWRK